MGWRSEYGADDYAPSRRRLPPRRASIQTLAGIDVSAEFHTQLQSRIDGLSTQGQAELQAHTGIDVSNARVQQGAASAIHLAQNGFNPANPDDNAALIHTISGGLCLAGPVGAAIGAYVELLWQVGNAIACPTIKLFASLGIGDVGPECGGAPCTTSGNWTTESVMAGSRLPDLSQAQGTFRSIAIPAIAAYYAQANNCKGGYPASVIVDACVAMWNATHDGPLVALYVPPLASGPNGGSVIPFWQNVSGCLTSDPSTCNVDPNVYYAFYPMMLTNFGDIANAPPPPPSIVALDPARVIQVNGGALLPPSSPRVTTLHFSGGTSVKTTSTATKVLIGSAVVGGGVLTGAAIYAWMKHRALSSVLDEMWKHTGGRALRAL